MYLVFIPVVVFANVAAMRDNKEWYTSVERLASEYERTRVSGLSPAEKEQLAQ